MENWRNYEGSVTTTKVIPKSKGRANASVCLGISVLYRFVPVCSDGSTALQSIRSLSVILAVKTKWPATPPRQTTGRLAINKGILHALKVVFVRGAFFRMACMGVGRIKRIPIVSNRFPCGNARR